MLTLGSLFDGSGGFPLAAKLSGIKPVWASEIEPFPIRVTTKRIPEMIHVGSITEIHGDELPPVDIITFGSPCQNLSMAGTGGNNQPYVVSETVTFSKVHGTVSAADGPKGIHSQIQEEEMTFWRQVFKTYSEVYETPMKSDKQILKWLRNPFTDSAAYKMWGNGVALPVVFYILNTLNNYVQKENHK